MDLLIALFFRVLRIRPDEPDWPDRDRFILSKGHSAIGLYVAMALRGYFPVEELATFDTGDSRLQGHPDMTRLPGLEASTGSLGQGLAVGLGIALGLRMRGLGSADVRHARRRRDPGGHGLGERDGRRRYGIGNLTAIVDCNGLQQYGWPLEPRPTQESRATGATRWPERSSAAAFEAFGWRVLEIDGHDVEAIVAACADARRPRAASRPTAILARTVKGRGLSFTEGRHEWHAKVATADDVRGRPARARAARGGRVVTVAMRDAWADDPGRPRGGRPGPARPRRRPRDVDPGRSVRRRVPGPLPPDGHRRAEHGRRRGRAGDPGLRAVALVVRRVLHPSRRGPGPDARGPDARERQDRGRLHRPPDRASRARPTRTSRTSRSCGRCRA